jgi:sec-independent protein translocase protein TatA
MSCFIALEHMQSMSGQKHYLSSSNDILTISEDIMGIGIWQLVIIFAIVLLLFGTKRLKTLGGDLGGAIRGFRSAMAEKEEENQGEQEPQQTPGNRESASQRLP